MTYLQQRRDQLAQDRRNSIKPIHVERRQYDFYGETLKLVALNSNPNFSLETINAQLAALRSVNQ